MCFTSLKCFFFLYSTMRYLQPNVNHNNQTVDVAKLHMRLNHREKGVRFSPFRCQHGRCDDKVAKHWWIFTLYTTTPFVEISIEYHVAFLVGIDANTMYTVPCAKAVKWTHFSFMELCGSNLNGLDHLTLHGVWSRFKLPVVNFEKRIEAGQSTRARTLPM